LWDSTASTKEDIVGILVESPKITKEKIATEREISRKILTVKEITLETVMDEINEFKKVALKIRSPYLFYRLFRLLINSSGNPLQP
jgi:hypothetical protein